MATTNVKSWTSVVQQSAALGSSKPRRKVTGLSKMSLKITSNEKDRAWHVFVGGLNKSTSEKDLQEHIEENSINVIRVTQMKPREDCQKQSAAFHISIVFTDREAVL